jgi:hypothetical protein
MLPHKPHRRSSREITLASWNLIRAGGGLASAAAGNLLLVGHVLGVAITGAGFVWLRLVLLSGSGTSAQRPARVS